MYAIDALQPWSDATPEETIYARVFGFAVETAYPTVMLETALFGACCTIISITCS